MSLEIKLRELRKQHNFSQQELADLLHVSRQAVSRWETGKAEPDIATLKGISELYNLTIDDLINDETKDVSKSNTPDNENRYSEYWEYLEALNSSIMLLTAVVTIAIPFIGIVIDIAIIFQLLKNKNRKNRLLFIVLTGIILFATSYNTYLTVFH